MLTIRDEYRARLDANPALERFCEHAEALVRADDPETFWDVQPFFQDLLTTNLVEAFVEHELRAVAGTPLHFMGRSSELHTPLVETAAYALTLRFRSPQALVPQPVVSIAEHTLLAAWSGRVDVETFTLAPPFRNEVFDRSQRLVPTRSIALVPGMVVRFESPAEAFRLHLEQPAILLQLQSATVASLRWMFDPDTLEPVRASAARLSSSRLQFTCHALAALGSPRSIPALKRLTTHPEHYVRWAAVQSLCAISRDDGLECLRRASEDDHPHVRRAAEQTLARC